MKMKDNLLDKIKVTINIKQIDRANNKEIE